MDHADANATGSPGPSGPGTPDLDDLRSAADEAATHTAKSLALYQLAAAYVALALLQLSDADYVLGLGQSLPIVSSTVPTKHFLAIAPVLLVILHIALLLHWRTLKRKVANVAERCAADEVHGARHIELLHPFVLTRAVLPPQGDRILGWSARALVFIGLVAIPLGVLVAIQIRSLAFHDPWLTMLQRTVVLADVTALWLVIPSTVNGRLRPWTVVGIIATALLGYYVVLDASIPSQTVQKLPVAWNLTDKFWQRHLELRGVTLQSRSTSKPDGKATAPALLNLQGWDLRFADLSAATLVSVDLGGADLTGADLTGARFASSKFGLAELDRRPIKERKRTTFAFSRAALADFRGQDLSGADFTGAIATGAKFSAANLSDARFTAASLDFADLRAADMRAGDIRLASLLGADLRYALLGQADLTGADLRGVLFYRNPKLLTRIHLADLTYARSLAPDETAWAEIREAIELATEDRRKSAQALADLQGQELLPTTSDFYRQVSALGMWVRYDFMPFPTDRTHSMSQASYVRLLQALIADELARSPRLGQALAWRKATENLWLGLVYAKDRSPQSNRPHQPPIRLMQRLMLQQRVTIAGLVQKKKDLYDARFDPWDEDASRQGAVAKVPTWFADLRGALDLANKNALPPLIAKLMTAAHGGDELAFVALAHAIGGLEGHEGPELREQVAKAAVARMAEPEAAVAIAWTFERGSDNWNRVLNGASTSSPDIDWHLGSLASDLPRMAKAASNGHVYASGLVGAAVLHESRSTVKQREDAWNQLAWAAYRGLPSAQLVLASTMLEKGDFREAAYWYGQAAHSGDEQSLNGLAWLLATSPEGVYRNGEKAVAISLRVLRDMDRRKPRKATDLPRHQVLDTLAAAYAAVGAFDRAIEVQKEAVATLPRQSSADLRRGYVERLSAYRAGRSWKAYPPHNGQ